MGCAEAEMKLHVKDDTRRVIFIGTFVFGPNGASSLLVSDFRAPLEMFEPPANSSSMPLRNVPVGFLVEPVDSVELARAHARYGRGEAGLPRLGGGKKMVERGCFVKDPLVSSKKPGRTVFGLEKLNTDEVKTATTWQTMKHAGLYAVYFYNCADMPPDGEPVLLKTLPRRPITFSVEFRFFWRMPTDATGTYLSYGDRFLPRMYVFLALFFLVMLALWATRITTFWLDVRRIHLLMLVLLIFQTLVTILKCAKLLFETKNQSMLVLNVIYGAALTCKDVTLFSVLLLLGSGWSLLREYLSTTDKCLLCILLPCQVVSTVCLLLVDEVSEGNRQWLTWHDMRQVFDVVCCCCVVAPVLLSLKRLRESADLDDSSARTMVRMQGFRSLYVVAVVYIYVTRVALAMMSTFVSSNESWITKACTEAVEVALYLYCGLQFLPRHGVPYNAVPSFEVTVKEEMKEMER